MVNSLLIVVAGFLRSASKPSEIRILFLNADPPFVLLPTGSMAHMQGGRGPKRMLQLTAATFDSIEFDPVGFSSIDGRFCWVRFGIRSPWFDPVGSIPLVRLH